MLFASSQPHTMILLPMPPSQLGLQACTTMYGLLVDLANVWLEPRFSRSLPPKYLGFMLSYMPGPGLFIAFLLPFSFATAR
jgi:hypothetical protein